MKLSSAIKNADSVKELLTILESGKDSSPAESATIKASWLGRKISVPNYSGSVNLMAVIDRVMVLANRIEFEFPEEERQAGVPLVGIIRKLDDDVDFPIENLNCIKKIFFNLSEFFVGIYYQDAMTSWYYSFECYMFDFYTKTQYIQVFGREPPLNRHCGNPDRWHAPPSEIDS